MKRPIPRRKIRINISVPKASYSTQNIPSSLPHGTTVDKSHIQWLTFKLKQGLNPCEGPVDQSEISIWI